MAFLGVVLILSSMKDMEWVPPNPSVDMTVEDLANLRRQLKNVAKNLTELLVHHLCQAAWEQREGHPDTVARYCCLHHPQYKYQNVIDRSGVLKKLLSSNSGCEMSVDTNATTGELDNNVIESILDGKNELLRDVLSSATNSINEITVSHLNKSQQNIVVDGKLYRCNKVRAVGE